MSNTPKAIFLDIDGTLVNFDGGPFQDDLEALKEAARLGHKLFLNSGRSFSNMQQHILDLPIWSGIAAGGGSHILIKKNGSKRAGYETIHHKWVNNETLTKICAWYLKSSKSIVLEGENDCYVINPFIKNFFTPHVKIITSKDAFTNFYPDELITKLTIDGKLSQEERGILEDFFTINSFDNYTETVIKGESKAKAMEIILDAFNIKRENSIAMGDSINDIDMIRYAGMGIAVGNASAELKAAAAHITADCGKGGIALALKRFVL
ncbi:MAG: HAD family hydrolase [Treponema sp.]|jgi:Cof subfamily protein (haloacid dehalogenase superfamily)|nr:HAD family hydrolase [Treponema sp.]